MEQIKVGDKVRVRENIPKDYVSGSDHIFTEVENTVVNVTDSRAIIRAYGNHFLSIPTKYLIKVEDEAKEPKYHKGDRVKVCSKNADRFGCVGTILEVHDNGTVDVDFNDYYVGGHLYNIDFLEPYIEQTEQTQQRYTIISEGDIHSLDEISPNAKNSDIDIDKIVTRGYIPNPTSFFRFDWDAYTADLAKEIALKLVNKKMDNDPQGIAEYAITFAEAVVAGLKKK